MPVRVMLEDFLAPSRDHQPPRYSHGVWAARAYLQETALPFQAAQGDEAFRSALGN